LDYEEEKKQSDFTYFAENNPILQEKIMKTINHIYSGNCCRKH
jgi:hypothetical protein